MSRIGRLPVKIEEGAEAKVDGRVVTVKGKLGTLSLTIRNVSVSAEVADGEIRVARANDEKETKAAHGLYRALINNMMIGVTKGYRKELAISGVGYRANATKGGKELVLNLGYSHPVTFEAPEGIAFETLAGTDKSAPKIAVSGIDKELVGQTAAKIRAARKPEPYHGYGVMYSDETVIRKAGKASGKQ